MKTLRYIDGVTTLKLDTERCTGCGVCTLVCPHAVFEIAERRVRIVDLDGCMECGACATNCAYGAISLTPGVGCAAAIIYGWLHNTEPSCGDSGSCCATTPAEKSAAAGEAESCCETSAQPSADAACCAGATPEPPDADKGCCSASPSRPEAPA